METQELTNELRQRLTLAIVKPLCIEGSRYVFRVDCLTAECDDRPEIFDVAVSFDGLDEAEQLSQLEIASRGILVDDENQPTHFAFDAATLVVVDEVLHIYPGETQKDFSFLQM